MRTFLATAAVIGLAAAPAFAQSTPATPTQTPATQTPGSQAAPAPGSMQLSVKHDLEQAGFKDVQVMPSSFLVRAKDKQGRPVMMVINPDSVTEITNVGNAPKTTASK